MRNLRELITEKLEAGKSYRRIAEECGVNHVSIARYHQGEATPNGKNLAMLAKYFHTSIEELVEDRDGIDDKCSPDDDLGEIMELLGIMMRLEPTRKKAFCELLRSLKTS